MTGSLPDRESVGHQGEGPEGASPRSYFARLVLGLGALGTLGIFALMVLINTDIFGRALFNSPVPGVPEMVQMGMVAIVFLQVSQALAGGRFTRSDAIFSMIVSRTPRLGHALGALFDLTGAGLMGLICVGEIPRLVEAFTQHEYFGHRGVFVAPRWPIDLIIVVGCGVAAAQFLLMAWGEARAARAKTPPASPSED